MKLTFYKYQGTGNDFILIDNRRLQLPAGNAPLIKKLCDRRFGIGADGLIYLQDREGYDFEMVYFNSDGRESTMCGNGGRCIVQFAHDLGKDDFSFLAIDGAHRGQILPDGRVSLLMRDVRATFARGGDYMLDTGSPHLVRFVTDIQAYPVVAEGRKIRYAAEYKEQGINVNFAEPLSHRSVFVRTYERGVEEETLSCGTGVVAAAIAFYYHNNMIDNEVAAETPGGRLDVRFDVADMHFTNIHLTGPAERVYMGEIDI
jgi:diaminopimelate epimerase